MAGLPSDPSLPAPLRAVAVHLPAGAVAIPDVRCGARWSAYLCNKLIPALLERDDLVRGLLRCVGLLPAASQLDWQGATETYAREFPMPWVAEAEGIGEP